MRRTPAKVLTMPNPRTAVLVAFSVVTAGTTQSAELRVDDLIVPQMPQPNAGWISPLRSPGDFSPGLAGEGALLDGATPRAWFGRDELSSIIAGVTRLDPNSIEFGDRSIKVPANDAAAVRECLAWVRQNLPPRIDLEVTLERVDEGGSMVLQRALESVRSGTMVQWADVVTRPILRDFDVEIAQSSASANPVVDHVAVGSCLALRANVIPGRDVAVVEAVARVAESVERSPIQLHHAGFGDLDRAARAIDQCGITFAVPRGQPLVQEWTTRDGEQLRLTCRAQWQDAPAPPRRDIALLCSGLLGEPVLGFRDHLPGRDEVAARMLFREEAVRGRDIGGIVVATNSSMRAGKILFVGDEQVATYRRFLDSPSGAVITAEVELSLYDLARNEELDSAPPSSRVVRIRAFPLEGLPSVFAGQREMYTLRDWDVEVAQSARIPDPKVGVIRDGYVLNLRALSNGTGRITGVAVDGKVSRLGQIEIARVPLNLELRAGGGTAQGGGAVTPAVVLPQDVVAIEKPELREIDLATVFEVDENGRAVLRRAATRLFGEGRDLAIVVQIK